jgi:hypothetical protein
MLISFDDFRKTRLESTIQESSVLDAINLHFDQFKVEIADSTRLKVALNEQYDPLCHHIMESVIDADHRQNKIYIEAYIDYCKLNFHNYIIEATAGPEVMDADRFKKRIASAIGQFTKLVKREIDTIFNTNRTSVDPSAGASSPPPHSHDGTEDGSAVAPPTLPVKPKAPTGAGTAAPSAGSPPLPSPAAGRVPLGSNPEPEEEPAVTPAAKKGGFWRKFDTSKGNWLSRGAKGLANLVRTPLHWAANKIKGAWRGDSLPESVVNAMALLLEDASDEQIQKIMAYVDDLGQKLLKHINKDVDQYFAALGTMPAPTGPTPTDVVAPAGDPRLNVEPGADVETPAAKKLPDSTVAAATGVDPKAAAAGAAAAATGEPTADGTPAVDPLATRVAYLQQHFGRKNKLFAKSDFLMSLYKILKKSDRQALDNSTIQQLLAGIVSDNPEAEWKEIGKPGKKLRLRIQPALEILQQAVFNCLKKFDADKKGGARLADEIIDLMRNEGKRAKVDMASVFDRIKDKAKAWDDAESGKAVVDPTAATDPTVAPTVKLPKPKAPKAAGTPDPMTPTATGTPAPTAPVGDGMSAPMTPRKPGEPPAPLDKPTGEAPPIVKKAKSIKTLGKDVDPDTASKMVNEYIMSNIPAFVNMPEDHPFFVSGLKPLIKSAVNKALIGTLKNPEGITKDGIEALAKAAVKHLKDTMDFPAEALAYAGVEGGKPVAPADAPKSDTPADAPKVDSPVAPEVPKSDAPAVKPDAPKVEPSKESPAQGILDKFLAQSAPNVLKLPKGPKAHATRVAMANAGFGTEEELENLDMEALALLIKKKQMGVEDEPKSKDEPKAKTSDEEPKAKDKPKDDGDEKKKVSDPTKLDASDDYDEIKDDDVDAILGNVSDDELMDRVDRLIDNGKIEKLKHYLQMVLDQGITGTPDKLVKRAIRMMISDKKAKGGGNRWADDHDEDDRGD